MGFSMVKKSRFAGRDVLSGTVSVQTHRHQVVIVIAADVIGPVAGAAAYADIYVGDGDDRGFIRIAPCTVRGDNSYNMRRLKHGHAELRLSFGRVGLDRGVAGSSFHPAFRIGEAAITVDLTQLYQRKALRAVQAA